MAESVSLRNLSPDASAEQTLQANAAFKRAANKQSRDKSITTTASTLLLEESTSESKLSRAAQLHGPCPTPSTSSHRHRSDPELRGESSLGTGKSSISKGNNREATAASETEAGKLDKKVDSMFKMLQELVPIVGKLQEAYADAVGDSDPDDEEGIPGGDDDPGDESEAEDQGVVAGGSPHKKRKTETEPNTSSSNNLLDLLAKKVNKSDKVSSKIDQGLADLVQSVLSEGMEEEQVDKLIRETERPENCECLDVPLVNAEIFDNLDSDARSRDVKLQRILKMVSKGLAHFVKIADLVLGAEKEGSSIRPQQIWDSLTDGINLTAAGCHAINVRRRDALKPKLQHKFKSLCGAKKPVTAKQLFGDDLIHVAFSMY